MARKLFAFLLLSRSSNTLFFPVQKPIRAPLVNKPFSLLGEEEYCMVPWRFFPTHCVPQDCLRIKGRRCSDENLCCSLHAHQEYCILFLSHDIPKYQRGKSIIIFSMGLVLSHTVFRAWERVSFFCHLPWFRSTEYTASGNNLNLSGSSFSSAHIRTLTTLATAAFLGEDCALF